MESPPQLSRWALLPIVMPRKPQCRFWETNVFIQTIYQWHRPFSTSETSLVGRIHGEIAAAIVAATGRSDRRGDRRGDDRPVYTPYKETIPKPGWLHFVDGWSHISFNKLLTNYFINTYNAPLLLSIVSVNDALQIFIMLWDAPNLSLHVCRISVRVCRGCVNDLWSPVFACSFLHFGDDPLAPIACM